MRVLVPIPFDVSHLANGRNLRIVHLVRQLARRCDLRCLTPDDRAAEMTRSVVPGVEVVEAASNGAGRNGMQVRIDGSYRLRRAIRFSGCDPRLVAAVTKEAAWADVVLGFDMPSVVYLLAAQGRAGAGARAGRATPSSPWTVCDLVDDPWLLRKSLPLIRRWAPSGVKAAMSMQAIRRDGLRSFDVLTAVGHRDATSLARATGRHVDVVPLGVDDSAFFRETAERELLVVFTGAMDFPPNVAAACWFVRQVWPLVLKQFCRRLAIAEGNTLGPGACLPLRCAIVGADPVPKVQRLGREAGVVVTGRVPDIAAWLRRARVAVAPMVSGCGMKTKVLEACAAGTPVVATPLGAENLPSGRHHGILVAEPPEQIADAVAEVLADYTACRAVGDAGRKMVREQFSWPAAADAMLKLLTPDGWVPPEDRDDRDGDEPQTAAAELEMPEDEEVLAHAAS